MFTTSCYIRKKTIELTRELEKLGYTDAEVDLAETHSYLAVDNEESEYYTLDDYCISKDPGGWGIDCGKSEDLFLALASLRDDSDRFQWFTDYSNEVWEREGDLDYSEYLSQLLHKATLPELIEHFKI